MSLPSQTKILSLCSGCGGFDYGAVQAGLTITEAHDFDSAACEGYERVTGQPIQQTDLTRINPHSLPDTDGIIGGPPCQEFSMGNVLGRVDGLKNLWPTTISIVRVKRPSWFLFENVKGLVTKHAPYFNLIVDQFKAMGYRVEYRLLNAADYGVPQTRERVFIAGRLDGQPWPWPTPTHTEAGDMFSPRRVSWCEALPLKWHETAERGVMPQWVTRREMYRELPLNAFFNVKEGRHDILHRPADKPAFTITTESVKRTRIVLDGTVYRANSLAMTRMQSLPDIELPSHVIGNAVPPLLARALFEAAFEREMAL